MKKAVFFSSLLAIILGTVVFCFYTSFKDSQSWKHMAEAPCSFSVYFPDAGLPDDSIYGLVDKISQDYSLSVVKKNFQQIDKKTTLIYSAISGDGFAFLGGYCLADGQKVPIPSGERYVSTSVPESDRQIGQMYDLFGDDHVEIWSLEKWRSTEGDMSGEYIFTSNSPIQEDKIVDFLSKETGISQDDLLRSGVYEESTINLMTYVFAAVFFINAMLFALFIIFYTLKSSKKIGIYKLNGWRGIDIFFEFTKDMFFWTIIATLAIDCLLAVLVKNLDRDFLFDLLRVQFLILLLELVLSSGMIRIISGYRISDMLKNRTRLRFVLCLSGIVRITLLGAAIAAIFFIPQELQKISIEFETIANWEKYGQYYVLDHAEIGEDIESITAGKTDLDESYISLYNTLCDHGAIYAITKQETPSIYMGSDAEKLGIDLSRDLYNQEMQILSINPNYLKNFPIYDNGGNPITIDESSSDRIILIPSSRIEEREDLRQLFQASFTKEIQSVAGYYRQDEPELDTASIHVDVLTYKTPNSFFSFSTSSGAQSQYMIQEPIIEVLTKSNMSKFEKSNICVQGASSPLKLPGELALSASMPQYLKDAGLDDNNLQYGKLVNWFYNEISRYKDAISQLSLILGVTYAISILVGYYLNVIFIESNLQRILVKKLLGYKLRDRYKSIFIVLLLTYVLFSSIFAVAAGFTWITGVLLLTLLGVDLLILSAFLRHIEKKNVLSKIKGG